MVDVVSGRNVAARIRAGKPAYAWDDPAVVAYSDSSPPKTAAFDEHRSPMPCRHQLPSFHDREALEEKMQQLRAEELRLSATEEDLKEKLSHAEAALSAIRSEKRELSTANTLNAVVEGQQYMGRRTMSKNNVKWGGRSSVKSERNINSEGNGDERLKRREELVNVRPSCVCARCRGEMLESHVRFFSIAWPLLRRLSYVVVCKHKTLSPAQII